MLGGSRFTNFRLKLKRLSLSHIQGIFYFCMMHTLPDYRYIHTLLDNSKFPQAREAIRIELDNLEKLSNQKQFTYFRLELYGLMIDLGVESLTEEDIDVAEEFFEKNEVDIKQHISSSAFHYNLANAKSGKCTIYYRSNPGVKSPDKIRSLLQLPINHYWAALKALEPEKQKEFKAQIGINLSNNLAGVGRLVEAIQILDTVLKEDSSFPQALISRGDTLSILSQVTNGGVSASLFSEIFHSYDKGIKTGALPKHLHEHYFNARKIAREKLENVGVNVSEYLHEQKQTLKEFGQLSEYRKYCLDNFLSLNEHALYCLCVRTEKDDLQIGVPHALFKTDILPKLELLLNRIKSEFAMARWLFYQYTNTNHSGIDNDMKYTELFENESLNEDTEMLRTAFRLCYGVLDKIAFGICRLYDLANEKDKIYFESFWNPGTNSQRWEKINNVGNFHLSALYSIASDLNTKSGQLKIFKERRNKLEHRIVVLRKHMSFEMDILRVYEDKDFIEVVSTKEFHDQTLHLLQLTRAAIFSFVYCVRLETIHEKISDNDSAISIGFKSPIPEY